ncbi:hypothetical protein TR51_03510 [Kitasatospora griseola]|uniref:Uncharacterized protein n=1 Tax=Kitasatospora griseola TaxID=2064 RepID=A0A0D0Q676_KITGR|nr:hypothetical protein [Kitasatospora griseola]KIQ66608.1 hypothetical protein TR51_03510 [Kitasatospora griseola]
MRAHVQWRDVRGRDTSSDTPGGTRSGHGLAIRWGGPFPGSTHGDGARRTDHAAGGHDAGRDRGDGNNTVAAGPLRAALSATGQSGYTPGALTDARLAFSYDGGATWTDAAVGADHVAVLDHTGATGKAVSLRITLATADGAKVTQTVTDAYAVR